MSNIVNHRRRLRQRHSATSLNGHSRNSLNTEQPGNVNAMVTLDAAALQAHFTRSLNLSLGTTDFTRNRRRRKQQPARASRTLREQQERIARNAANNNARIQRRIDNRQENFPETTLAQNRGLVAGPQKISEEEWKTIELKYEQREFSREANVVCPICCDSLGAMPQTILCCSHVFHKNCLESFERFIKSSVDRTCPMCRKPQYQKKNYQRGIKMHRHKCARKIQASIRRFLCRLQYSKKLVAFYGSGAGDRDRAHVFHAKRIGNATEKLLIQMDKKEDAVNALFAELDKNLAISRSIFGGAESDEDIRWNNIREKALLRCDETCPICMCAFKTTASRKRALLSCTHVFHEKCIQAFEKFNDNKVLHECPVCRSAYTRVEYCGSPVKKNKEKDSAGEDNIELPSNEGLPV